MRSLRLFAGCAAFAALTSATCFAADSPWNGTWKLDEAKSKLTGTTFVMEKTGNMYTVNDGSISYKFACDGKDYPIMDKYTTSCTEKGSSSVSTSKLSGKVISTTTHELSADGKSLTEVRTGKRPDGSAYTDKESYVRTAGSGTGFAGTWKNTKSSNSAPGVMIIKLNGDVLHTENPAYKSTIDAKLDGTLAPVKGPTVPAGVMLSNKADGATKVVSVVTLNGKEISKDIMTLAADGKSMTDVSWTPGKESEKQTFVYEKQ